MRRSPRKHKQRVVSVEADMDNPFDPTLGMVTHAPLISVTQAASSPAGSPVGSTYCDDPYAAFPGQYLPSHQGPITTVNDIVPTAFLDPLTGEHVFPCPHCDKQYRGKHARSIWRRHLQDKHSIPLAVQPRKTRWDNVADRPKTDEERRQRTLESKRRWARKNRATQKAKKLGKPVDEFYQEEDDSSWPSTPLLEQPEDAPGFLRAASIASTSSSHQSFQFNIQPNFELDSQQPPSMQPQMASSVYHDFASLPLPRPSLAMQRSVSLPLPVMHPDQQHQLAASNAYSFEEASSTLSQQFNLNLEAPHFATFAVRDDIIPGSDHFIARNQLSRSVPPSWPLPGHEVHQHIIDSPQAFPQATVEHLLDPILQEPQLNLPAPLLRAPSRAESITSSTSSIPPPVMERSRSASAEVRGQPPEQVAMNLLLLKTGTSSAPNSPDRSQGPASTKSDASMASTDYSMMSLDFKRKRSRLDQEDGSPDTSLEQEESTLEADSSKRMRLEMDYPLQPLSSLLPPSSPPELLSRTYLLHRSNEYNSESSGNSYDPTTPPHPLPHHRSFSHHKPYRHLIHTSSPPMLSSPSHPDTSVLLGLAPTDLANLGHSKVIPASLVPTSSPNVWRQAPFPQLSL